MTFLSAFEVLSAKFVTQLDVQRTKHCLNNFPLNDDTLSSIFVNSEIKVRGEILKEMWQLVGSTNKCTLYRFYQS